MVREEADRFRGVFRVGVGPLKAPVGAFVTVVPDAPPYRYRLRCEMSVRFLGEADAEASLDLVEVDTGVDVNYRARVAVQGRLAGYGLEFLHAAVQRNIDQFFQRFGKWLSRGAP